MEQEFDYVEIKNPVFFFFSDDQLLGQILRSIVVKLVTVFNAYFS